MLRESLVGHTIKDYTLQRYIGGGAMGAVYQAKHPKASIPLAIKVLSVMDSDETAFVRRFEREAVLLKSLSNPHIVALVDCGEERGLRYFVMPFINGPSLDNIIARRGFSPLAVRNIMVPLVSALSYAHGRGIVHRDIKPANVMIETRDGTSHIYLMDFGLGKRVGNEISINPTASNMTLGTPHYMSPEQVLGTSIDHRADLYSLAVMLYQLLLGVLPFDHPNIQIVALRHVEAAPPPPRQLNPKFPKSIQAVLLRALAKRPEDRYQSAIEFQNAYSEAVKGLSEAERKALFRAENAPRLTT